MKSPQRSLTLRTLDRTLMGALLLLLLLLFGIRIAGAAELIPSIGLTNGVGDDSDEAKVSGGLALRGNVLPFLMSEVGVSYRTETRFDGNLEVRQWPLTASLWLNPIPFLYAGGGAGWYNTSLDYADGLPFESRTESQFGVHLGGGLRVPLAPRAAIDLNGRYIFMENIESALPPGEFDPDFWNTSVGLAIRF